MNYIEKWKENISLYYNELIVLFLLIFPAIAYGAVEIWSVTLIHIVVIAISTIALAKSIMSGKIIISRSSIDVFLFLFLALTFFSLLYSANHYVSRISLYKSFSYIAVFYYVLNIIKSKKRMIALMWAIVIFGSFYATAALSVIGSEFLGFKNFSNNEYITLTFVNRNHFAGYLEMIVWIAVGLSFINKGSKRVLLLFLAAYMASSIFFSLSRGGSLGFLASSFFISTVLAFYEGKKKHLLIIGGFLLLISFTLIWIGIEPIIDRMETLRDPAVAGRGRLEYWAGTYQMILDNFWFGTGFGTYSSAYPQYQTAYASHLFVSHAHNDYLELAGELGVIGFLSFAALIIAFFYTVLSKAKYQKDHDLKILGIVTTASVFSIIIHSVTDFNFHIPSNVILFAVVSALAINANRSNNSSYPKEILINISKSKTPYYLLPLLFISFLLLVAATTPYVGKVYFENAKEQQMNKEYDSAIYQLNKAIKTDIGNPEYYARIADIEYTTSNSIKDTVKKNDLLKKALANYNKAISIFPVNSYYYTKKAFVLQKLFWHAEADSSFQLAIKYFFNSPYMHYNMAGFYHEKGKHNKANKEFKITLQLGANYFSPIISTLEKDGRDYEYIRKIIPNNDYLRRRYANNLVKHGKYEEAAMELKYAYELNPTEANANRYIYRVLKNKNNEKAISLCIEYLEVHKNNILLQKQLVNINIRIGNYKKAIELLINYSKVHPHDISLQKLLASTYIKDGTLNMAKETYDNMLQKYPDNASIYYLLAQYYRKIKNNELLLENLKNAVYLAPNDVNYRYQLGMEYKRIGILSIAIEQFEKCLEIKPSSKKSLTALNSVKKSLGINDD